MPTAEEYIKNMIGDLAIKNAALTSDNERLRAENEQLKRALTPATPAPHAKEKQQALATAVNVIKDGQVVEAGKA